VISVEVEDGSWTHDLPDVEALVQRAAEAALAQQEGGGEADIAVLLADDDTVADLNTRFRGQAKPTNVLSFPAAESARPHLGDIALAHGVCAGEATAQGKSLSDHLAHLIVHGVLHLLGYDHEADAEAEDMEGLERDILARLGVPDPYRQDEAHA
jgi:probable rRNA maturation factor